MLSAVRCRKTSASTILNQFVRDGAGASDDMLWNQTTTFVPGVSERSSGTTSVLHFDRLGTPTARTNPSGYRTGYYSTDAFGNPTSGGLNGSQAGFAGDLNYQTDAESGLMLLGHRYYDSGTGRFITQDPMRAGRNWYDYCDNNPVGRVDPRGLWSIGGFDFNRETVGGGLTTGVTAVGGVFFGRDPGQHANDAGYRESRDLAQFAHLLLDACAEESAIADEVALAGEEDGMFPGSGGRGACFASGTLVEMADGSFKPIQDVQSGDWVKTRNQLAGSKSSTESEYVLRSFHR